MYITSFNTLMGPPKYLQYESYSKNNTSTATLGDKLDFFLWYKIVLISRSMEKVFFNPFQGTRRFFILIYSNCDCIS